MLLLTHHKTLFAYVETNTYLYCLVMYAKKKIHKINNHVDANIIDKQISQINLNIINELYEKIFGKKQKIDYLDFFCKDIAMKAR